MSAPHEPGDGRHLGGRADDAQRRAAIRRFVLAHHPDRGGDPAVFDAGLRALRAGFRADPADAGRPDVTLYRKRGPVAAFAAWVVRRWARPGRHGRPVRVR